MVKLNLGIILILLKERNLLNILIKIISKEDIILIFFCIDNNDEIFIIEVKGKQTENDLYKWESAKQQGYNLVVWKLEDIREKEKQYNITTSEIHDLILKCIQEHNSLLREFIKKRLQLELYRETKPICPYCNKVFVPNTIEQKFCCKKHHNLYKQLHYKNKYKTSICPYCNQKFIKQHGKQKFCCKEHASLYYKKEKEKSNCLYCGKKFEKIRYNQKYCCREHQLLNNKLKEKNKKKIGICKYCNTEFIKLKNAQKYCCLEHKILNKKQKNN